MTCHPIQKNLALWNNLCAMLGDLTQTDTFYLLVVNLGYPRYLLMGYCLLLSEPMMPMDVKLLNLM
jgi:hypothetical protein